MSDEYKGKLPPHLIPLLNPTPSGTAKLLAAWDDLSLESQMQVLLALDDTKHSDYLSKKVLSKALDSSNAYVRYLAAKGLESSTYNEEERKALEERIAADPEDLVKYCLLELGLFGVIDKDIQNPASFFNLPHGARLAKVRQLKGRGKEIASLITYAVENLLEEGKVSETELYEILADYLINPSFKYWYRGEAHLVGEGIWAAEEDIEALWQLIPKIPEKLSYVLLAHLPEGVGDFWTSAQIPQAVLDQLTSHQLKTLLYRDDIELEKFRKQIFRKPADRLDNLRCAAISRNFDLTYREFSNILQKPDEEKFSILRDLSFAGDLSLVLYQALHDILNEGKGCDDDWQNLGDDAETAVTYMNHRQKELEGSQKQHQFTELKLYKLAETAAPWKKGEEGYQPSGKLEFLAPLTVPGDTWKTFMNYSEEWGKYRTQREELVKELPRSFEIEEEEEEGELNAGDKEPESSYAQPLSRKEFYAFHLDRSVNWVTPAIFLCYVVACIYGWSIISAIFNGNHETLMNDIGITAVSAIAIVAFTSELKRLRLQQKLLSEEKLDLQIKA